ncbi:ABC transporter substrate-binding protein [Sphingobacterium spiritivorum]|uniref:ABC transporter substrate-binding protein n=1 Tax=Sphingobacterium spiritivorum TaxID=258 RepID=UPI003DA64AE0
MTTRRKTAWHRVSSFILLTLIIACSNPGEKKQTAEKISAVDARGKEITLETYAQRVVVLFEPFVDQIYMLNAGDRLVGIPQQIYQNPSTYHFLSLLDKRIARKQIVTPTFGGRSTHVETLVALEADLAIVYEHDKETIAQLEDLHIPVYVVSSRDKDHIYNELVGIGTLLGREQRAEAIVGYVEQEVEKMKLHEDIKRKKVYYAWSKGRVFSTSCRGSLVDLSMQVSGAENACPLTLEAPNISAESLYKWNPDLIVLWNSKLQDVYSLKELEALPAVIEKQVYNMEPTFYYDPHTVKFLLFAKQLRQWCYPTYSEQQFKTELQQTLAFLYSKKIWEDEI